MRPASLLIISNGIGEDSVGAELARRLPSSIKASAYPTLGSGAHYDGVCEIVGPRATLASAGSRVAQGTIARDVRGGLLGTVPPGLAFMHRARRAYDRVLVIGDFIGNVAAPRVKTDRAGRATVVLGSDGLNVLAVSLVKPRADRREADEDGLEATLAFALPRKGD